MFKILILTPVLLMGCAHSPCEIAIINLQPAKKIPKTAAIEISDSIMADDGGQELLQNYVKMSTQTNSLIEACKPE